MYHIFLAIFFILTFNVYGDGIPVADSGNLEDLIEVSADLNPSGKDLEKRFSDIKESSVPCPKHFHKSPLQKGDDDANSNKDSSYEMFFDLQVTSGATGGNLSSKRLNMPYLLMRDFVKNVTSLTGQTPEDLLSMPDRMLLAMIKNQLGALSGTAAEIEEHAQNSLLILKMSQAGNSGDAMEIAASGLQGASRSQKINFLASYIRNLDGNYEYDMIDGGETQGEDRWDDDLHEALGASILSGEKVDAGVCRHMHQMGVRLAQKIGFNEAFGVGFRTVGSGHRTLVLTDPENPQKVVQINYGRIRESDGVSGVAALSQNGTIPDAGIRFRIYNGKDKMAIIMPSELGGILNKATGGDDQDLGVGFQDRSQFNQVGVKTPYGTIRLFHAASSEGTNSETHGATYTIKKQYNDYLYGEYGGGVFTTERPTDAGNLKQTGLYGRMTHGVDAKILERDNFVLRTFGELHARGTYFSGSLTAPGVSAGSENSGETNSDANLDLQLGVSADYRIGDVWNRTSIINQSFLAESHASNWEGVEFYAPMTAIDHESHFSLGKDLNLQAGLGVTLYNLGTGVYSTYRSDLNLESERSNTNVGVQLSGRMQNNTPFWLPQAEHTGSLSIHQGLGNGKYYIGVTGEKSFEQNGGYFVGAKIGGRFGGKRK